MRKTTHALFINKTSFKLKLEKNWHVFTVCSYCSFKISILNYVWVFNSRLHFLFKIIIISMWHIVCRIEKKKNNSMIEKYNKRICLVWFGSGLLSVVDKKKSIQDDYQVWQQFWHEISRINPDDSPTFHQYFSFSDTLKMKLNYHLCQIH